MSAELLARIGGVRKELAQIERLVRAVGTKVEARQLADLIETTNTVEWEVMEAS